MSLEMKAALDGFPHLHEGPSLHHSKKIRPELRRGFSSQELGNNPVLALPWPRYTDIISAMREVHEDIREASMKIPTVKYQSGLEESLAAFLLKMTSLDAISQLLVWCRDRVPVWVQHGRHERPIHLGSSCEDNNQVCRPCAVPCVPAYRAERLSPRCSHAARSRPRVTWRAE